MGPTPPHTCAHMLSASREEQEPAEPWHNLGSRNLPPNMCGEHLKAFQATGRALFGSGGVLVASRFRASGAASPALAQRHSQAYCTSVGPS